MSGYGNSRHARKEQLAPKITPELKEDPTVLTVRLRTYVYHDRNGLHIRKDLNILRRRSSGFDFLSEDCSMTGPDYVASKIVNLHECKDGVYTLVITDIQTDWETGNVEDYDYKLVPSEPNL